MTAANDPASVTMVLTVRIPADGVVSFQDYEAAVLPLLREHGGQLQRRLRNGDGSIEIHLLRFTSREAFEAFRADPRRAAAAPLLAKSGAVSELIEVSDVD